VNQIELVSQGRVLKVVLNRPEKRNALSAAMCRELVRTLDAADQDAGVRVVLLEARGKSFCAGMDLAEIAPESTEEITMAQEALFTVGSRLAKPLVGAVQGAALGGGTGLVANCHIAIASEDATFGLTEIRLGLWPFLVHRAVALAVGERRALEMALTGRTMGATEAHSICLVHEVAADAQVRAQQIAGALAGWSPTAIRTGLEFLRETRGKGWEDAGRIAARMRNEVFESEYFREAVRTFRKDRSQKTEPSSQKSEA
jgi:enoyl-CoA hydratase/carnithine racemase